MIVVTARSVVVSLVVLLAAASTVAGQAAPAGRVGAPAGSSATPGRGSGQRTGTRDRETAPAVGTGAIEGRVLSAEGAPLRRAQIQLTSADANVRKTATTDSDGRYSFSQLPAGRYTVRANKGGYVSFAYGQRGLNDTIPPIVLGTGESRSALNIVLPRGSAVSGRVTDEFGDPVLQAQVQALRYQFQSDGERRLVGAGMQAATDDLGQFRLYNLTPGEYVISATARNQFTPGPPRIQQDEPDEGYAPTFYPGTSNPAEAQPITVGLGQEFTVQIQLVPTHLSTISGTVVDSQGRPVNQGTPVMLRPAANLGGANIRSANTTGDASFNITAVPPGDYVLEVRPRPGPPRAAGDAAPLIEGEFAYVPLSVGGGDITGLRIVTGKGTTLSGRVVFDGTPPAAGTRIRVVPQSAEPARAAQFVTRNGPNDGVVAADGTFQLDGVAAPSFLRITFEAGRGVAPPEQGRYMTKSVLVDGVDLADIPLDPSRRGSITGITVVVTDKLTDISGTVSDSRGAIGPVPVVIVPETLPAGVSPTRFIRVLQSDDTGRFNVRGMPAGRYTAVALSAFDQARQYDPEVIQRVRQAGKTFSVREGERVTLDLKVTSDF